MITDKTEVQAQHNEAVPNKTDEGNQNGCLRIDDEIIEPIAVQPSHYLHSLDLTREGITFTNGISTAIQTVSDEFTDQTRTFESTFNSVFRFNTETPHGNDSRPWFYEADFWPYTDDSEQNAYHSIPYAYTGVQNCDMSVSSLGPPGETAYPFTEDAVLAYMDPEDQRVRVFATDSPDTTHAGIVAAEVFQPDLRVIGETDSHLIKFHVQAKPLTDPYSQVEHSFAELSKGHVTSVEGKPGEEPTTSWVDLTRQISGDLWGFLMECRNETPNPVWTTELSIEDYVSNQSNQSKIHND